MSVGGLNKTNLTTIALHENIFMCDFFNHLLSYKRTLKTFTRFQVFKRVVIVCYRAVVIILLIKGNRVNLKFSF